MSARRNTATRRDGVYIPIGEVQLHLLLGWSLVDDCETLGGKPAEDVLMAPPQVFECAACQNSPGSKRGTP